MVGVTLKSLAELAASKKEDYHNEKHRFIVIKCANINVKTLLMENLLKLGLRNEGTHTWSSTHMYFFIRYGANSFFDMEKTFIDGKYGTEYLSEDVFWLV